MSNNKKSFFERLTGSVLVRDDDGPMGKIEKEVTQDGRTAQAENPEEGQLTVDVYQTPTHIVVQSMVAGVDPASLGIILSRESITVKGSRSRKDSVMENNFYYQELYWGAFSRTIQLPQEVEIDEAEASAAQGLLTIKLPKVNRDRTTNLKVKAS